jgi:hypothetical protein
MDEGLQYRRKIVYSLSNFKVVFLNGFIEAVEALLVRELLVDEINGIEGRAVEFVRFAAQDLQLR